MININDLHSNYSKTRMYLLSLLFVSLGILPFVSANPITYDLVRGVPYNVSYDHRAITINGTRTMLISGAIHYPRSTPAMWPYIMKMAKQQGLNTIQTYVFWNIHEPSPGELYFGGRANLSRFLQEAANAGLFVNLRIGPYVCAEWNYGGLPVWLNQVANISFRSHNEAWERLMKQFILTIIDYVTPYLAKNGGPIILAQIENEFNRNDQVYIDWCGSLITNELSSTQIPWIMCNGHSANSSIESCNSCNCVDDGWVDNHLKYHSDQPMIFTENEGLFHIWGAAVVIRPTTDLAYSVAEWFAAGGAYHAYYMWHGGNNYGRTAGSGITTMYADDVLLHSDGTPNEPKYTHLSRLQHLIGNRAAVMLSQNSTRIPIPHWNGTHWSNGTQQFAYTYLLMINFVINQFNETVVVLFHNQNISMAGRSVRVYDDSMTLLWDSANPTDISSDNTQIIPIVSPPLQWHTWSESTLSNLSLITSPRPLEQLNITNDETIYLWYRRNITLTETSARSVLQMQTRKANAFLFFLDGQYLGEFDTHTHEQGPLNVTIALDLSRFKMNQQYLFEILSISLGIDNDVWAGNFEYKGIVGNVWLNGQLLCDDETHLWEHQKGLVGEYYEIYTEQGSSKVKWNPVWTTGINKPTTWFQTRFDLDHLIREDTTANPILLDIEGLNRGHAFINGNDLGLYWLIQGICFNKGPLCQQVQTNCLKPMQRYYHIPPDWFMPKNNLLTIFDDLGAPSPGSVGLVQRIVTI
jgi:beta-galactosidase